MPERDFVGIASLVLCGLFGAVAMAIAFWPRRGP